MPKVYLVEMTNRETGHQFYKVGWCSAYDVMDRFSAATSAKYGRAVDQYDQFNIRVLASAYSPSIQAVKNAERVLKEWYPKNLNITESFSGITEIVMLNPDQRDYVIQTLRQLHQHWKLERAPPPQDTGTT